MVLMTHLMKLKIMVSINKKIHNAKINGDKEIVLWGTGNAMREFIYADDLVKGIIHILENYKNNGPINLGSGFEVSINELADIISSVIGYKGQVKFDSSKPDGMKKNFLILQKVKV